MFNENNRFREMYDHIELSLAKEMNNLFFSHQHCNTWMPI